MIILSSRLACSSLGITYARVMQGWEHCLKLCSFIVLSCFSLQQFGFYTREKCPASCLPIPLILIPLPCLHSQAMELAFHTLPLTLPSSQPLQQLLLVKCFFPSGCYIFIIGFAWKSSGLMHWITSVVT